MAEIVPIDFSCSFWRQFIAQGRQVPEGTQSVPLFLAGRAVRATKYPSTEPKPSQKHTGLSKKAVVEPIYCRGGQRIGLVCRDKKLPNPTCPRAVGSYVLVRHIYTVHEEEAQ